MKKILALIMFLALSLSVFAACNTSPADKTAKENGQAKLDDAASYLYQLYKDHTPTMFTYKLDKQVSNNGEVFPIEWSVEVDDQYAENVTIATLDAIVNEETKETKPYPHVVLLPSEEVDIEYTLIAKLSLKVQLEEKEITLTAQKEFKRVLPKGKLPDTTKSPLVRASGIAYSMGLKQATLGKTLYVDGTWGSRYLNTTEDINKAAAVFAEAVEGGYKFYILGEESAKLYVDIYYTSENKVAVRFDAAGDEVFAYDATVNAWTTKFDGDDMYLGTYNNYNTVSASKLSYINAENTGVSQFPVEYNVHEAVAYNVALDQVTLGKTLYVDGTWGSRYLNTTENVSSGAKVYFEAVEGGYKFYILGEESAKLYADIYYTSENKVAVRFDAAGDEVFAYNATVNAWVTKFDGDDMYLGTYNNYNTVSASKLSYINAENTGVSQFPIYFVVAPTVEAPEVPEKELSVISNPVVGTAYKFGMIQGNLDNKLFYLAGGMSGFYMATTDKNSNAIDVYLEAVEGGYYLYTLNGESKLYINCVVSDDGAHVNGAYEAAASTIYRYDAEKQTLIAVVNETDYWFGTRNDKEYTTVGPCAVSYEGFYCKLYGEVVPCEHANTTETVVESTCTVAGSKTVTCDDCGAEVSKEEFALAAHTEKEVVVAATCTVAGSKTVVCDVCEATLSTEEIPATGHTEKEVVVNATCVAAGSKTVVCEVCEETLSTEEIPATGHSYGDDDTCDVCGTTRDHVCDPYWVAGTPVDPTCTEDGYTTYTCSICEKTEKRDIVAASGHDWVAGTPVAPTCTEDGYTTYTCSICEATEDRDPVVASGHDYKAVVTAPTCVAAGYTTYTCSICSHSYEEAGEAATGVHVDENADYKCDVCSSAYEHAVIENVTVTELFAVAADIEMKQAYTVTGTVSAWRYADSTNGTQYGNFYLSDGTKEILVYGATASASALVWSQADGKYVYTNPKDFLTNATTNAILVGDTVTLKVVRTNYNGTAQLNAIVLSVTPHTHDYKAVVTAPTCTEAGYTTHTCSICSHSYEEAGADATGHDYSNGVCTVCGHTEGAAEKVTKTIPYTFANYAAGTQYASGEVHKLDEYVTVTTTESHFTTELRLYSSSTHDGYAIITCAGTITGFSFVGGNKNDVLNVYGSTDGKTWTLIEGVSVTSGYTDTEKVSVDFSAQGYTYLKLDVAGGQQLRIKSMTITFII